MQSANQTKHVMNKHGVQLAQLARQYGVPREAFVKFLKDKEKTNKLFEELITADKWFEKLQAEAQKIGARVYLIPKLVVDYKQSHNDAAMAGGPQTESSFDV